MEKYNIYELIYMYHTGCTYAGNLLKERMDGYLKTWTSEKVLSRPKGSKIFYEDLYLEGLLALYEAIDSYREDKAAGFITYCKKLVDARQINFIQRTIYKKQDTVKNIYSLEELSCKEDEEYVFEPETRDVLSCPEYKLAFHECLEALEQTIKEFSVAEKEVLYSWSEGMSYEEGSKRLNMTKKRYEGKLQKVKKTVRQVCGTQKMTIHV